MSIKIFIILLASLLILTATWHFGLRPGLPGTEESLAALAFAGPCQSSSAPSYIQKLSSDIPEARQAIAKLLELANESPECREAVINAVVAAMNKADVENNYEALRLWLRGSGVLGELKAVETLDLLIAHLDRSEVIFRASMAHAPVLSAVTNMGEAAVPKLAVVLKTNPNKHKRLAAAYCLLDIGGPEALDALKSAQTSDPEGCVRRYITLMLPDLDKTANSNRPVTPQDGELLMQRILAYRCGN